MGYKESRRLYPICQVLRGKGVTALQVYVDDIIVTENDEKEKKIFKQCLDKEWD